jgi:hypothetical protein
MPADVSSIKIAVGAKRSANTSAVWRSLARAAWSGFLHATNEIAEKGTFDGLGAGHADGALNAMFVV